MTIALPGQTRRNVLVTGGAGYIGSHVAKALSESGLNPVVYDDLSSGNPWSVQWGPLVQGDVGDKAKVLDAIHRFEIGAVIHMAASACVSESLVSPERYFENNVAKALVLLDTLLEAEVRHVVFSSSCATYGVARSLPVTEHAPQLPISPYGYTKLVFEQALQWYGKAHALTWATLRYFNAAGADSECTIGEAHEPETHLIPMLFNSISDGKQVNVYGKQHPTQDGTCVRDYVHVTDLADVHVRALAYLVAGGESRAMNVGTGRGYSVSEIIRAIEENTSRRVHYRVLQPRQGDPPALIADSTLAHHVLDWYPRHSCLDNIIKTAWRWHLHYREANDVRRDIVRLVGV
jgi:UDP-arabinose 4-epimerase